jgi:hypothetical protein
MVLTPVDTAGIGNFRVSHRFAEQVAKCNRSITPRYQRPRAQYSETTRPAFAGIRQGRAVMTVDATAGATIRSQ